ncbi:MAG: DUF2258 domain-containing protein [Archaeoglobaceae archaeon]|nr:DUF2258 domain-containing protein [Archaeoglobaceae archaeon]MCX8152508.1 DUF2258 domain-containing protein [Archaeoglobaceae archaeon]MDW8013614.1 DUF2258 domain-containing protein [Archaeoglobaceae archaeon]
MKLSSGYVIVGIYADKIRKTLFAQLRDAIKSGQIDSKEVAKAVAELNVLLYEIFVNRMKVDKGDVIRVRIEYDVADSKIVWKYDTLAIEVFRRVSDAEVSRIVKDVVIRAGEITRAEVSYEVKKAGTTELGDDIYYLYLKEQFSGALIVTSLNDLFLIRGAVTLPVAKILDKTKITYTGEEELKQKVSKLFKEARNVEVREALRAINEIKAMLGEEKEVYYTEEET